MTSKVLQIKKTELEEAIKEIKQSIGKPGNKRLWSMWTNELKRKIDPETKQFTKTYQSDE